MIAIPKLELVPESLHFLLESESVSRKPNCAGIGTRIKEFLLESESESEILKRLESNSESRHAQNYASLVYVETEENE